MEHPKRGGTYGFEAQSPRKLSREITPRRFSPSQSSHKSISKIFTDSRSGHRNSSKRREQETSKREFRWPMVSGSHFHSSQREGRYSVRSEKFHRSRPEFSEHTHPRAYFPVCHNHTNDRGQTRGLSRSSTSVGLNFATMISDDEKESRCIDRTTPTRYIRIRSSKNVTLLEIENAIHERIRSPIKKIYRKVDETEDIFVNLACLEHGTLLSEGGSTLRISPQGKELTYDYIQGKESPEPRATNYVDACVKSGEKPSFSGALALCSSVHTDEAENSVKNKIVSPPEQNKEKLEKTSIEKNGPKVSSTEAEEDIAAEIDAFAKDILDQSKRIKQKEIPATIQDSNPVTDKGTNLTSKAPIVASPARNQQVPAKSLRPEPPNSLLNKGKKAFFFSSPTLTPLSTAQRMRFLVEEHQKKILDTHTSSETAKIQNGIDIRAITYPSRPRIHFTENDESP